MLRKQRITAPAIHLLLHLLIVHERRLLLLLLLVLKHSCHYLLTVSANDYLLRLPRDVDPIALIMVLLAEILLRDNGLQKGRLPDLIDVGLVREQFWCCGLNSLLLL